MTASQVSSAVASGGAAKGRTALIVGDRSFGGGGSACFSPAWPWASTWTASFSPRVMVSPRRGLDLGLPAEDLHPGVALRADVDVARGVLLRRWSSPSG